MIETDEEPEDQQQKLLGAGLKLLLVALAIGAAIGLGTYVVVNAIGLNDTELTNVGPGPVDPVTPLPTTALPVPTDLPSEPPPSGLVTGSPTAPSGDLFLAASPQFVEPMERINLTGQWPGHDAQSLMVQRFEDGEWVDFGVQARLDVGTFATYVQTGREGDNKFRIMDPESGAASNEVTVTIG